MRRKPNILALSFIKLVVVLSFIELISTKAASAQIPSTDSAAIMKYMNAVSSKIETVLKADKSLYGDMMDAMKKISAMTIKDTALVDAALDAYHSKYFEKYGAIVKKAGVDMNKVASDLKAKFSGYVVSVNSDYAILMKKVYKKPDDMQYKPPAPPTVSNITSFDRDKHEGCSAVSGSNVTFDGLKVHVWAAALVAGGCEANGSLKNTTTLPSDATSIGYKMNDYLHVKGYAVSVGGASACLSDARGSVFVDGETVLDDFLSNMAVAPVAWYAKYDDDESHSHNVDMTKYKGKTMKTQANVNAEGGGGGVTGTKGRATSKITKAELSVTK